MCSFHTIFLYRYLDIFWFHMKINLETSEVFGNETTCPPVSFTVQACLDHFHRWWCREVLQLLALKVLLFLYCALFSNLCCPCHCPLQFLLCSIHILVQNWENKNNCSFLNNTSCVYEQSCTQELFSKSLLIFVVLFWVLQLVCISFFNVVFATACSAPTEAYQVK